METAMASRVRTWIAQKALKASGPFQITMKDIQASMQADELQSKQISAALSKLAKLGHLAIVGRRNDRVSPKGTSRSFVYEVSDPANVARVMAAIPARRAPAPYERHVTKAPRYGGQRSLPLVGVEEVKKTIAAEGAHYSVGAGGNTWFGGIGPASGNGGGDLNPTLAKSVVNDLVGVSVHIETHGLTRTAGLELLRLAERVLRGAK